jgi:hypothetical protein
MDTREYIQQRLAAVRPAMAWNGEAGPNLAVWATAVRTRLKEVIGIAGWLVIAPAAETTETQYFRGYRRETLKFFSRPGVEVFAYYLIPDNCRAGQPGVLCLPGHGRGVDSIVGIAPDGTQREIGEPDEYQADYPLQCVQNGWPALAIEQISFGHRRDPDARSEGPEASSCHRDSTAALMLGETMTGWRVWDAMRALDVLASRPEVSPQRLVTMGISGGGLTSLWTAALDARVTAAVVSGYFNTWRDSICSIQHCVDNYAPGLLHIIDMPDMAGLVAPRGLFVEGGLRDPIFPAPAFERAVAHARELYAAAGRPERFGYEQFDGEHEFRGHGAFRFLREMLG